MKDLERVQVSDKDILIGAELLLRRGLRKVKEKYPKWSLLDLVKTKRRRKYLKWLGRKVGRKIITVGQHDLTSYSLIFRFEV